MTKELREKLESLRVAAAKLNASTDQASRVVQEVEKLLGEELSLGISAEAHAFKIESCEDPDEGPENGWRNEGGHPAVPDVGHHLAYGRVAGKFRLHVVSFLAGHKSGESGALEYEVIPLDRVVWSSCPRETKMESFASLPDLLGMLADRAVELAEQGDMTAETVRGLLDAMRGGTRDADS